MSSGGRAISSTVATQPTTVGGALSSDRIPIILRIDAEPDGLFIDRERPLPWQGYERSVEYLQQLRNRIASVTGSPAHFTWLFRLDQQVAETYGSAEWPLMRYGGQISADEASGDELGVHVHPYRWSEGGRNWIADYGDQAWVESCVRGSLATFRTHQGRVAQSFTMGDDWMNDTMQLLESLGVRYELTIPSGTRARTLERPNGQYRGAAPDYRDVPRGPWRPSADDFRLPATDSRSDGILAIPLSTFIPQGRTRPRWKPRAAVAQLLGRRPRPRPRPKSNRLNLESGPRHFPRTFEYELATRERLHFLFAIRTSIFSDPQALERMTAGLDYILAHPQAQRFIFATPRETIELLARTDP